MRPSWEATWLEVATVVARRSLCSRAQVGAVIVTVDNRPVAVSYNGPASGFDHGNLPCTEWCLRAKLGGSPDDPPLSPVYDDCCAIHAEMNCVLAADRSTWQGGTIYVSGSVCLQCAKVIANSGLAAVVYRDDSAERAYRQPQRVDEFFVGCGLSVTRKPIV